MNTIYAKVLVVSIDVGNYVTYVFRDLENNELLMCTQFPNWEHRLLNKNEVGYLEFKEIQAGKDKWFDGKDFHSYNYDNIQFIKFIPEQKNNEKVVYC